MSASLGELTPPGSRTSGSSGSRSARPLRPHLPRMEPGPPRRPGPGGRPRRRPDPAPGRALPRRRESLFRLGEQTLYRAVLRRRPAPKVWRSPLRPGSARHRRRRAAAPAASAQAVQAHYDLSNDFFALWLDPSMAYSSGMWEGDDDLASATDRKVRFFLEALDLPAGGRLLDVGCGWGAALVRATSQDPGLDAVGLTLSPAQKEHAERLVGPRAEIRLEPWQEHLPAGRYDGILSFGAFEHFARDGSSSVERVLAYRRFFASCYAWLVPGGRLGARDDRARRRARHRRRQGPGAARRRRPRSLPRVALPAPRRDRPGVRALVPARGAAQRRRRLRPDVPRVVPRTARARRGRASSSGRTPSGVPALLASSEVQFRTGALTNYRLVLRRRDTPHERRPARGPDHGRRRPAITSLIAGPRARGRQERP